MATPPGRWRSAILHEGMHALFRGLLPEHFIVDLPDDRREGGRAWPVCSNGMRTNSPAIIVEPLVQGAGGMRFHDAVGAARACGEAADRYDLLLIFDEIFTGFGRTGAMFACAAAGVTPDIITLSKALTGGTLPLAATVARRKCSMRSGRTTRMHALMHGPTYMGNALACAAANASLDLFEREPRLDTGRRRSRKPWRAILRRAGTCQGVKDVRVRGAIGVVELERIDDLDALRARFVEEGVFIRPFGNIVYLTPAFTIGAEELARLTAAVIKVVGKRG